MSTIHNPEQEPKRLQDSAIEQGEDDEIEGLVLDDEEDPENGGGHGEQPLVVPSGNQGLNIDKGVVKTRGTAENILRSNNPPDSTSVSSPVSEGLGANNVVRVGGDVVSAPKSVGTSGEGKGGEMGGGKIEEVSPRGRGSKRGRSPRQGRPEKEKSFLFIHPPEHEPKVNWALSGERKFTGKNELGAPYPTFVKRAGYGLTGGALGYGLGSVSAVKTAAILGGNIALSAPLSFAMVFSPAALPLLKRLYARRCHEGWVRKEFQDVVSQYVCHPDEPGEVQKEHMRKASADLRGWCGVGKTDRVLINEDPEGHLVYAVNKAGILHPEEMPFLGSRDRYARHCFAKIVALCGEAREYLDAKGNEPNTRKPENLRALNDDELKTLRDHAMPLLSPGTPLTPAQEEDREEDLEHLLQVSASYGRLLENRHRDQRESSTTFLTGGSAAAFGLLTGSWVVPAVLGGGYLLGRRIYRGVRKYGQTLEMDHGGKIISGVFSEETYKGVEKALCNQLHECTKREQLTDDEKRWLPRIQMPDRIKNKRFRSVDSMALMAARPVINTLVKMPPFPKALTDEEKVLKRSEFEEERSKLKRLTEEEEKLRSELKALKTQKSQQEGVLDSGEEVKRGKEKKADTLSLLSEQEKIRERRFALQQIRHIDSEVAAITERLKELREDSGVQSDSGEKKGWIDMQKERVKAAKDAYFKKPEEESRPLTTDEIMQNVEIQRAFAVRVHEWFEQQRGGILGAAGRVAGEALGGAAQNVGGKIGKRIAHAAADAAVTGVAAGGVVAVGGAFVPALSGWAITIGSIAGAYAGLRTLIKGRSV